MFREYWGHYWRVKEISNTNSARKLHLQTFSGEASETNGYTTEKEDTNNDYLNILIQIKAVVPMKKVMI